MKLLGDLSKLVAEAEEAQAVLANKAKIEQETRLLDRQLGKRKEEYAEVEKALESAKADIVKQNELYEHERARLAKDLQTFTKHCEDEKAKSERAVQDQHRSAQVAIDSFRAQYAGEQRKVEEEVATLRKEHETLTRAVTKLKQQIGLL